MTENQNGRMDFGYRFYAETVNVITYCDFLAIQQADTNTEQVLVDIGKVGDVGGIFPSVLPSPAHKPVVPPLLFEI